MSDLLLFIRNNWINTTFLCYTVTMNKLPDIGQYNVEVYEEDNHLVEVWSLNGEHHRIGKPAVTYYDKDTGKEVIQVYKENGLVHRADGPAHIQINPDTDIIYLEEHFCRGKLHRDGAQAVMHCNPKTGNLRGAESFEHGRSTDGGTARPIGMGPRQ